MPPTMLWSIYSCVYLLPSLGTRYECVQHHNRLGGYCTVGLCDRSYYTVNAMAMAVAVCPKEISIDETHD